MERGKFNSKLGSILALAGSAVGLGNIWRFPYMVNEYGGGAFLLIYILCVIIVALPIMLSEFIIGRRSGAGAYDAVGKLCKDGPWKYIGTLVVFIPFATLCYYCVIGGWTLDYFFKSCAMYFTPQTSPSEIEGMFGSLVSGSFKPIALDFIFLAATAVIIGLGVSKGIEKFSKIMMPLLFFVMAAIAVWTITLPGASEGLRYLLKPDFSKLTPQVFVAAMGQAFYSMSLGMGIMITYSSYLDKKTRLVRIASCTMISDFLFAVIAACAIIPALFAYNMPMGQGTGLVFKALPVVFSRMPIGSVIATVFFFAVLLAAITSAMSLFEVPVSWLTERFRMSRRAACTTVFAAALAVGAVCSLSFGPLSGIQVGGKVIFDIFDYVIGNYLMPFAGLLAVIFVGWKMKREDFFDEVSNGEPHSHRRALQLLYFAVKYVSPLVIICIFLSGLL